jgi:putative transposase
LSQIKVENNKKNINFKHSIMKKTKFTETQIVKSIKEHENGRDAKEICRELGITTAAFYKWRQRYGGMYAELSLVYHALKDVVEKKL